MAESKTPRIRQDDRPIAEIHTEGNFWRLGYGMTTKIVPYEETGEMAMVTWFAVYNGERIMTRVNGKHVVFIDYDDPLNPTIIVK